MFFVNSCVENLVSALVFCWLFPHSKVFLKIILIYGSKLNMILMLCYAIECLKESIFNGNVILIVENVMSNKYKHNWYLTFQNNTFWPVEKLWFQLATSSPRCTALGMPAPPAFRLQQLILDNCGNKSERFLCGAVRCGDAARCGDAVEREERPVPAGLRALFRTERRPRGACAEARAPSLGASHCF